MKLFSPKQPNESMIYRFGFASKLALMSETISAISSVSVVDVADPDTDLAATMYDAAKSSFSGNYAYIWLQSGTDGKQYQVTVTVISSSTGQVMELDAVLPVREE